MWIFAKLVMGRQHGFCSFFPFSGGSRKTDTKNGYLLTTTIALFTSGKKHVHTIFQPSPWQSILKIMMIQRATHPLKKTILKCVHNSFNDDAISDTSESPGCLVVLQQIILWFSYQRAWCSCKLYQLESKHMKLHRVPFLLEGAWYHLIQLSVEEECPSAP